MTRKSPRDVYQMVEDVCELIDAINDMSEREMRLISENLGLLNSACELFLGLNKDIEATREYLKTVPKAVPSDFVLVHNSVRPAKRAGTRGFRFWLSRPDSRYTPCDCGWAAHIDVHYRVIGLVKP